MKYISTRGEAPALNFEEVLLAGLASDGGLYVPESLPQFSMEEIQSWKGLGYAELAYRILLPFVEGCIPEETFKKILEETYEVFEHPAIAPLVQVDTNDWILELFQGPTLAFKDFALQLLGRLLDYVLQKRGERVVIMGATSGDTGSAAIEGCRHCENVDIFILHPHNAVSGFQRRQMTTVLEKNVFNVAVNGNFDDCQNLVKASFRDQSFLPDGKRLVAVNSINWARIMAQIVYYFYASLSLGALDRKISFSVPTGNFGDIFAGYLANKMGLPVDKLFIATNTNDVLHRIMTTGLYDKGELVRTLSPSMDICISSNFERLMLDLYDRDGSAIKTLMETFENGSITLSEQALHKAQEKFDSASCDDEKTCKLIADFYQKTGYLLDPHTATGIAASQTCRSDKQELIVTLATAHPAKFAEAIEKSGVKAEVKPPPHMADLFEREERYTVLENDKNLVQQFIVENITG